MAAFPSRPDEGLPATGVTLLLAAACFVGALLDIAVRGHLGACFAVAFVLGCGWAGARVSGRDLVACVIAPPLVFAAVVFLAVQFLEQDAGTRGFLVSEVMGLGSALGTGAPILFVGMALAAGLAATRLMIERSGAGSAAGRLPAPRRERTQAPEGADIDLAGEVAAAAANEDQPTAPTAEDDAPARAESDSAKISLEKTPVDLDHRERAAS